MMRACGLGLFAFVAAVGVAQDPVDNVGKIASKGQKGDLVPSPFRAYMVVDKRYPPKVPDSTNPDDQHPKNTTNKIHDFVCEHGLNPVVAVFIGKDAKLPPGGGGVGKLTKELNLLMELPDYRGNKLAAFVTFLKVKGMQKSITVTNPDKSQSTVELDAEYPDDEDRDVYARDIKDMASGLEDPKVRFRVVFGLAPETSKAAAAWSLEPADEVTVVFFNRIRIIDRWKFAAADGPTDDQIKTILATVEQSVLGTKKP